MFILLISSPLIWICPMLEKAPTVLTSKQTIVLEKTFHAKPYLKPEEKHQLAMSLNISEECVQIWFNNRRKRSKKYGLQYEGENLSVRYWQCCTHTHTHTEQ